MNSYADALRLIDELGEDHPHLASALSALGIELKNINAVQPNNVKAGKNTTAMESSLALSQEINDFEFNTVMVSEQASIVQGKEGSTLNEIKQTEPLDIYAKPAPVSGNVDISLQWNANKLKQQLFDLLIHKRETNQPNIDEITKQLSQKKHLITFPKMAIAHLPAEIWLYIDVSHGANVYQKQYQQIERLLQLWFGSTVISKKIMLKHERLNFYWQESGSHKHNTSIQPPSSVTVIAIAPNNRWNNQPWRDFSYYLHQKNITSVFLPLQHAPCLTLPKATTIVGTDKLFAAVSLTPYFFTLAMLNDIAINVLNLPVEEIATFINHPDIGWSFGNNSGFWRENHIVWQQKVSSLLSAQEQQHVVEVLTKHLSHQDQCWSINTKTLSYVHCTNLSSPQQKLLRQDIDKYYHGLSNTLVNTNNNDYVEWQMNAARHLGSDISALPQSARNAFTVVNLAWQKNQQTKEQLTGLNETLWREMHNEQPSVAKKAYIYQQGNQLFLANTSNDARLVAKVADVHSLMTHPANLFTENQCDLPVNKKAAKKDVKLTNQHQSLTLNTLSSKQFYWAKSLSVTNDGVVATTNYVKVSWPTSEVANSQRGYLGAVIELTDDAPKWMLEFKPQLDEYGLFAEIILKDERFKLRYIPPGSFVMGSPEDDPERDDDETPHRVSLTQGCWLGETTVSQALWQMVMGDNPSKFIADDLSDYPVENINWLDSQLFVQGLNKRLHGLSLSLPTEAQWEYSCRAGTSTPFYTGNNLTTAQANYDGNYLYADYSTGDYREKTAALTMFSPNAWGLYQMHGNVLEWCEDEFKIYDPVDAVDPVNHSVGADENTPRVLRGGSWRRYARPCRGAYRDHARAGDSDGNLGLRVAQVEPSKTSTEHDLVNVAPIARDETNQPKKVKRKK